jgi:glycine/D-amino acid oxidase-like deaminating enzyme
MSCQSSDVVVIGGGVMGCAIAYNLARQGQRCLLLEKGDLATGASGANTGLVLRMDIKPGPILALTHEGYQRVAALETELDRDLEYRPYGALLLMRRAEELKLFRPWVDDLNQMGIPMESISPEQIREIEPAVQADGLAGALYLEEAQINPLALVYAYRDRAVARGAQIRTHCGVRKLETAGGMVTGVQTTAGKVSCGAVVLATGAWTGSMLASLGISLPLFVVTGQVAVTEPLTPLLHSFVGLAVDTRVEFEQRIAREGIDAVLRDLHGESAVISPGVTQARNGACLIGQITQYTEDPSSEPVEWGLSGMARSILPLIPALARVAVVRTWAAPVPFTVDHEPILGPVGGLGNLYCAAGFKSVFVVAPVMAELIATWVCSGQMPPQLAGFTAERFRTVANT